MDPKDFWNLTPTEFWWIVEAKRPVQMYGSMNEHEVKAIYEETYGVVEEEDD